MVKESSKLQTGGRSHQAHHLNHTGSQTTEVPGEGSGDRARAHAGPSFRAFGNVRRHCELETRTWEFSRRSNERQERLVSAGPRERMHRPASGKLGMVDLSKGAAGSGAARRRETGVLQTESTASLRTARRGRCIGIPCSPDDAATPMHGTIAPFPRRSDSPPGDPFMGTPRQHPPAWPRAARQDAPPDFPSRRASRHFSSTVILSCLSPPSGHRRRCRDSAGRICCWGRVLTCSR